MTDNQNPIKKKPQVALQVSEANKISMEQDAKDIGESVSSVLRVLITRYWDGYIKKQKSIIKK